MNIDFKGIPMKTSIQWFSKHSLHAVLIGLIVCTAFPELVFADEIQAYRDHQAKSLGEIKAAYEKIKAEYPDNPDLQKFDQRIELIDALTVQIIKQFESVKSAAMQNMISLDIALPVPAARKVESLSAADLMLQYQAQFATPLPVPEIESSHLPVLREYYDQAIHSAMDFITPRGCSAAIVNKAAAANTLSLTMVIHFLHIADPQWNKAYIERLPDLMKRPATLEILEEVSFKMLRPRTAYRFFLYRTDGDGFDPDYFLQSSERLLTRNEYLSAIRCLDAGLEIAKKLDCVRKATPLAVKLADVYYTMGHLSLAIEVMEEVLQQGAQHDGYCKAAALQLKYLYEEGRYRDVTAKASSFLEGGSCAGYHPEIMYIAWLASRRDNLPDSAETMKKKFMEKYPQHPLCANMLFDSAINALASTNYSQAREILEQIEYHHPQSKIIPKVRELKERLNKVE
jgi:tetratricopeptide (TPR) repeat protein